MPVLLAAQWRLLLFRGIIAILFGMLTLFWPNLTLAALVALFGAYALLSGTAALIMALTTRDAPGFGSLLLEGVLGVAAAVVTFLYPGITTVALLAVIAAWAIVTGIAAILTAVSLRKELSGEWPLPVAGALSLLLGILLLLQPQAGALAVAWMIGLYALLTGATQLALALRLRQLSHEIAGA